MWHIDVTYYQLWISTPNRWEAFLKVKPSYLSYRYRDTYIPSKQPKTNLYSYTHHHGLRSLVFSSKDPFFVPFFIYFLFIYKRMNIKLNIIRIVLLYSTESMVLMIDCTLNNYNETKHKLIKYQLSSPT